jgi:tetratricopeptide (TPR) repeat protein
MGRTYTLMGDPEPAIAACRRGVELASDPVVRANALGWLGAAHLENEELAQAIPLLQDAIARHQQLGSAGGYRHRELVGFFTALLSDACLRSGEIEQARDLAAKALAVSTAGGWPVSLGYAERTVGRVALAAGKLDEAEVFFRRALQTFLSVDARCQVARCHLILADVSAARGDSDRDAARAALEIAHEMFRQMPAPRLVERTERMASALGLSLG